MIDIYTERKDSKDWIFYNDLYFNLNTGNEDMSQKEIDLIQQVDEAKLTPDKHIETKYGLGTIRNLSSGCKTLLNIVKHPDKVVNVEECCIWRILTAGFAEQNGRNAKLNGRITFDY